MFRTFMFASLAFACAFTLTACNEAQSSVSLGIGPNPSLPRPEGSLIPTVYIAPAKAWPEGVTPVSAPGTKVVPFATGLDHPRWLHVLPNGDVLVAM